MTADETKNRIVEAALAVLKRQGYAGASARSIAAEGRFNQALIFYHFGSVRNLLLAADDAAYAIVAQFLGLEMLTHLDGSTERAERLFELAASFAGIVALGVQPSDGAR